MSNKKKFEKLYKKHRDDVFVYFLSRSRTRDDALDLTAETFLAAWAGYQSFAKKSLFKTWIFGIARNKLKDYYSFKTVQQTNSVPFEEGRDYDTEVQGTDAPTKQIQQLRVVLTKLKEIEKEVLIFREVLNYSFKQCGELLGVSEGNARVIHHRALKKSKKLLLLIFEK